MQRRNILKISVIKNRKCQTQKKKDKISVQVSRYFGAALSPKYLPVCFVLTNGFSYYDDEYGKKRRAKDNKNFHVTDPRSVTIYIKFRICCCIN